MNLKFYIEYLYCCVIWPHSKFMSKAKSSCALALFAFKTCLIIDNSNNTNYCHVLCFQMINCKETGILRKIWKQFSLTNMGLSFDLKELMLSTALTCDIHISEKKLLNKLFYKEILIGNKKWMLYNNIECKKSWSKQTELLAISKVSCQPVVLCIWWDWCIYVSVRALER